MLKEFQDAAQAAERKERLITFVPAIVGMILAFVLVLALQRTALFPQINSSIDSAENDSGQTSHVSSNLKTKNETYPNRNMSVRSSL